MVGRRLVQGVLALIMVVVAVLLPQASARAAVYGPYYLMDDYSGLCLDNPHSNTHNNIVMDLYTCVNASNERWVNDDMPGNGEYWIKNESSGKCLTVLNASTARYAAVIQYTCSYGANEVWKYIPFGGTGYMPAPGGSKFYRTYKIENENSRMCLTVENRGVVDGSTLLQYDCDKDNSSNVWYQIEN